ncbi:hypothetical protein [Buttiauxella gaviniae]|uniref:hypothetical protein n=1 Tax=Buttiauxella gaviniae TaxID=82990 RepID=UPI0039B12447
MKAFGNVLKAVIGGLIWLSSHQVFSAPADLRVKTISVPVYNLITETLIDITPRIKGERNEFMMQLVCDLARDSKSQEAVNAILTENNLNPESIPAKGSSLSLLVNNDKPQQQAACASFIATSLFFPVDNSVLFETKKDEKGKDVTTLDSAGFAREMKVRMSIAQATAQFYAVIANNLKKEKNMTWVDYQKDVASITADYAPEYLRSIKRIFAANQATYIPRDITVGGYDVQDSNGRRLIQNSMESLLVSRGVDWLGNGKIMGKEYFVDIQVIDSAAKVKSGKK